MRRLAALVVLLLVCCPGYVIAQSTNASLTGYVTDPTKAVIRDAKLIVINQGTNVHYEAGTDEKGSYYITNLPPGMYRIEVEKPGFKTVIKPDIVLHVQDTVAVNFEMALGSVSESVTVINGAPLVNTESAAVSTVVTREQIENMPLNGRTFQGLVALAPGVVLTAGEGQLSVNGQRDNANYFTIDGVSANVGASAVGFSLGASAGGAVPGFNAQGATNSLASLDALEEFKVQTSTYSAEFGRFPGGQVQIRTRSGKNKLSGAIYDYLRNDALDANDWFANAFQLPKAELRQNDFGFVLGGPIVKDRTFFFVSYEGLRLRLPAIVIQQAGVPGTQLRQDATAAMQPYLDAFPLPSGPENPSTGLAPFFTSYSNSNTQDTASVRIDHIFGPKLTIFGRYNYGPSSSKFRNLASISNQQSNFQTLTGGAVWSLSSRTSNELTVNYSRVVSRIYKKADNYRGAIPPPDNLLFPSAFSSPQTSDFRLALIQTNFEVGRNADNMQRQVNLVDNFSLVRGRHTWKLGVDYRRMFPVYGPQEYSSNLFFFSRDSIVNGIVDFGQVTASDGNALVFNNFSAYVEDSVKLTRRLMLNYGLRWDLNPAPRGERPLFALTGTDSPATISPAPVGTPIYATRYTGFAPRFGFAYSLGQKSGWESVLRGGFGFYYDSGTGNVGAAVNSFPFVRQAYVFGVPLPLDSTSGAPPPPYSLAPPYPANQIFDGFDQKYSPPVTYQWSVAVDQALGTQQHLTVSYVGNAGRRLLRTESFTSPNSNFVNDIIVLTRNVAASDYAAMQVQFQRNLSRGLQGLVSYTWSHAIDSASSDTDNSLLPSAVLPPSAYRASSNFDVRHALSFSASYEIPSPHVSKAFRSILHGWAVDVIAKAQTAMPVDVVYFTDASILGIEGAGSALRPDRNIGVPLYIYSPTLPGGREINPNAFSIPTTITKLVGTAGRNSARGFPLDQLDFSTRRQFVLSERVKLQFKADLFNVFNHPNFGLPQGMLSQAFSGFTFANPGFGVASAMLNQSLGGLSPLYQMGGPRSTQFSLKLTF